MKQQIPPAVLIVSVVGVVVLAGAIFWLTVADHSSNNGKATYTSKSVRNIPPPPKG